MAAKKNSVTYNGTGRRKTSVARVFMTPGKGNIVVNGKTLLATRNFAYGCSFTT